MILILSLFVITTAVILAVDVMPRLLDWSGRIRIGRYADRTTWNKKITELGARWINRTPKIKVTDNTRLVIIDRLRNQYSNHAIQHWQEASLLLGVGEYLKHNEDQGVQEQAERYLSRTFASDGSWKRQPQYIDGAILAYAVMNLPFIDSSRYRRAFDQTWQFIQEHIGEDGTVQYRKFMKSYRYVDTIGFICPFLVKYGIRYQVEECVELACRQIKAYEQHGMLKDHFIPAHAYRLDNLAPLGLYGWGRGLGWYAIGLVDAWNELPSNHKYKWVLEKSVVSFAKAAMNFQQKNGSWNWTVTRSESRPDSSATATLSWFMVNAARIPVIQDGCIASYEKAVAYLMSVTRRNGAIDFSQGDTKDIGVYSMLFNILPFTQGFCMRSVHSHAGNEQPLILEEVSG